MTVRLATPADRDRVARLLAAAFRDDPAMAYIFPDPAVRARMLPRVFAVLFDSDGKAGQRFITEGTEAATLWRGPGRASVGWLEMLSQAPRLIRAFGAGLSRALRVAEAIEAQMPRQPFLYLHIAGCDPQSQGKGFGSRAIVAGLDQANCQPVYLETPNPATLGLYARHGFDLIGDWSVPHGGPRFWSMLRPAREV